MDDNAHAITEEGEAVGTVEAQPDFAPDVLELGEESAKLQLPDMILYQGTKTLFGGPMTRGAYNAFRGWQMPADEDPTEAGYLVEYTDGGKPNVEGFSGYVSWSPADVFERTYRTVEANMSFSDALVALKLGNRIHRAGWNGKGMFLYLVPANSYPAQTGAAKAYWGEDALVPYGAYIAMKTAQENVVPWLASQTDVLAEDWEIVIPADPAHG
jgi:hypothetical protein